MTKSSVQKLRAKFLLEAEIDIEQGIEQDVAPLVEYEQLVRELTVGSARHGTPSVFPVQFEQDAPALAVEP